MVCGNFILPEPASYVFFYAFSNLRNLLYIIASMVLGGLFRNPNIASPAINMLYYMVIVMVTPFYSDLAALSQPARLAYCSTPSPMRPL